MELDKADTTTQSYCLELDRLEFDLIATKQTKTKYYQDNTAKVFMCSFFVNVQSPITEI